MNIVNFLNQHVENNLLTDAIGFQKKEEWKSLSWKQLRQVVFKTANALRNAGVSENDRVAIFADNSAEWITFDLAVLALGAVTVPIYASSSKNQVDFILQNAGAKILLVGNQAQYDIAYEILGEFDGLQTIVVAKKSVWIKKNNTIYLEEFIEKTSENFDIVQKTETGLATIIYTSGTTGSPKGVMLSHHSFISVFEAHLAYFDFKNFQNEHSLAFLPLAHVFERSWTLLCLYFGAKVSFLEDTKAIANALVQTKPTMMCAVPRFYQKIYNGILQNVEASSGLKQKIFNKALEIGQQWAQFKKDNQPVPFSLKPKIWLANALVFNKIKGQLGGKLWFLPCGGAAISAEITTFFDAIGLHITPGYGMTETTATVTASPLKNYVYGTAGQFLGDTKIKIGENNEILVKGSNVMMGYFKLPKETAAAFTDDGWLKTGDAGEIDASGNLTITDRIKDLMKTANGKYIAPQNLENTMTNLALIDQILVIAEDKPFVAALIFPDVDAMKALANNLGAASENMEELVLNEKVVQHFKNIIDERQKDFPDFEKIKRFKIIPKTLEIGEEELTPTLKIKRQRLTKSYQQEIDLLYAKKIKIAQSG